MPRFHRGLVVALCASAHANVVPPTWHLGKPGQTCTHACDSLGLTCVGGYWPGNTKDLLQRSKEANHGWSPCVDLIRETLPRVDFAPSVANASWQCFYQPKTEKIRCSATPPTFQQRYCPCSTQTPQFKLGGVNESCTNFCARRGGICSSDSGLWPTDLGLLKEIIQPLGQSCSTNQSVNTTPFHAPSIAGDTCYWPADRRFVSCSSERTNTRRVCPCLGAKDYDVSPGSNGMGNNNGNNGNGNGNSGYSHSGTRSRGECRGGGFRMGEGTGGTKKLVPGGLQARNNTECRDLVLQYCPEAEGATFNSHSRDCKCEIGMTGFIHTAGNTVCWFTDGRVTVGSGSLINRAEVIPVAQASSRTSYMVAAGGLAALAAAGFGWKRRAVSMSQHSEMISVE